MDATGLIDDYYVNVLDWSQQNILAVAKDNSVYLWSDQSNQVTQLAQPSLNTQIIGLSWSQCNQQILALTTSQNKLQLWDTNKMKLITQTFCQNAHTAALSWNQQLITSGSRSSAIATQDIRIPCKPVGIFNQNACGLKWSPNGTQLDAGGNDNSLKIWQLGYVNPIQELVGHTSGSVKALTWSTQQNHILISGGGTQDMSIRQWNTVNGTQLNCIDSGSQVFNLVFSSNYNEFVSTHGYITLDQVNKGQFGNQINIWNLENGLDKIACLNGGANRVLFLARSPDGSSIVTGSGEGKLKFRKIFE